MKIAILGGSFNPLHIGHASLAETIHVELGYDKILFVPTCIPPHKEINSGVSAQDRLGIVKAFCDSVSDGHFVAEDCEIQRGGISYTVDTLEFICEKYKDQLDSKPALLMGQEIASEFDKWKNPQRIAELSDLIIVPRYPDVFGHDPENKKFYNRPSGEFLGDFNTKFESSKFAYKFKTLEIPILPVSSTEIRARIGTGRSFRYLVPAAVYDYIETHNLYRNL